MISSWNWRNAFLINQQSLRSSLCLRSQRYLNTVAMFWCKKTWLDFPLMQRNFTYLFDGSFPLTVFLLRWYTIRKTCIIHNKEVWKKDKYVFNINTTRSFRQNGENFIGNSFEKCVTRWFVLFSTQLISKRKQQNWVIKINSTVAKLLLKCCCIVSQFDYFLVVHTYKKSDNA